MSKIIGIIAFAVMISCSEQKTKEISAPEVEIPKDTIAVDDEILQLENGVYLQDGKPFSGYLLDDYPNGNTKSLKSFWKGKLEGKAEGWHENGKLAWIRKYADGYKTGVHIGWWSTGAPKFQYTFSGGKHEGAARDWHSNGKIYKLFHYQNGKEEGSQKMWTAKGKIRANYVVKNGKRYGLAGYKNCQSVFEK